MTYIVHTTEEFDSWLKALRDIGAAARIFNRMRNAEDGNFGATAPIGKGVWEMKIDHGPGYRVYYTRVGEVIFLLLHGGDKSTQKRDIAKAIEMAKRLRIAG